MCVCVHVVWRNDQGTVSQTFCPCSADWSFLFVCTKTPPLSFQISIRVLVALSESSLLVWFLQVSLIVIIQGRSPMEVSGKYVIVEMLLSVVPFADVKNTGDVILRASK